MQIFKLKNKFCFFFNPLKQKIFNKNHFHANSYNTRVSSNYLVKNALFTVGIFFVSFGGAALIDAKLNDKKKVKFFTLNTKNMMNRRRLENEQIIYSLIGINIGVFIFIKFFGNRYAFFIERNFTNKLFSPLRSNIFSMFAHGSASHLFCNMVGLYSFGNALLTFMRREEFLAFYLSAGAFSSFSSILVKTLQKRFFIASLGASGGIFGLLGFLFPFKGYYVNILLIPIPISLKMAIYAIALFDFMGIIMRLNYLDHAAHLGGLAFGYIYIKFIRHNFWEKRKNFFSFFF